MNEEGYESHTMNRVMKTKILLAFFVLFMIFDYVSKGYIFWLSVEHTKILRSQYKSEITEKIFHLVSELGDKYVVGFIIFTSFQMLDHPKSFIMI
jgi:hypothetical protein